MTNFEKIQSMTKEEFAKWFDDIISNHEDLVAEWFSKKYCENCGYEFKDLYDTGVMSECSYCEINKKCKFFPNKDGAPDSVGVTEMWLSEEV